jgi:hypothetical protein
VQVKLSVGTYTSRFRSTGKGRWLLLRSEGAPFPIRGFATWKAAVILQLNRFTDSLILCHEMDCRMTVFVTSSSGSEATRIGGLYNPTIRGKVSRFLGHRRYCTCPKSPFSGSPTFGFSNESAACISGLASLKNVPYHMILSPHVLAFP